LNSKGISLSLARFLLYFDISCFCSLLNNLPVLLSLFLCLSCALSHYLSPHCLNSLSVSVCSSLSRYFSPFPKSQEGISLPPSLSVQSHLFYPLFYFSLYNS
jgi:hypothetical protein